ncbi:MAG: dephospho-CoA kinase [Bacteroidales bacterium]|nr:dephospho-CoA kinase [Bacteroidales bacterium]
MKTIGITGIIGSGKTTVCHIFEHLGIPVYYSDEQAKQAYTNPQVLARVQEVFGTAVTGADGGIDKVRLADIVFADKQKLQHLNSIVHPWVKEHYLAWKQQQSAPYILFESAIIFECGFEDWFDEIIVVNTPEQEIVERVKVRSHISQMEIKRRLDNQQIIRKHIPKVQFVIDNAEQTMVLPQILAIDKIIREEL